jgi:hypothetical protein
MTCAKPTSIAMMRERRLRCVLHLSCQVRQHAFEYALRSSTLTNHRTEQQYRYMQNVNHVLNSIKGRLPQHPAPVVSELVHVLQIADK